MNEIKTIGRCMSMCPKREIDLRERENLLHSFELAADQRSSRRRFRYAAREKCVKEYSRPTVGKQDVNPEEIRPAAVLVRTTDYLVDSVCTLAARWADIYEFVFDRLRAVRQDLVIQEAEGWEAIHVLEHAVRFHVFSDYRLCTEAPAVFSQKINDQHTQECLKRLINLYNISSPDEPGTSQCQSNQCSHTSRSESSTNQAEFEATYLLFNLGEMAALKHYYSLSYQLRYHKDVRLAYNLSLAYLTNNWVRVFKLLARVQSPTHMCAVHRHFPNIQWRAFQCMNTAYSSKNLKFPLAKLTEMLWLNTDTETQGLCERLGVAVIGTSAQFQKSSFNMEAKVERSHCDMITRRLQQFTIPDILHGNPIDSLSDDFSSLCTT